MSSLKTHLASLVNGGYSSIIIPCFADSDPYVLAYADRVEETPITLTYFWNGELDEWTYAGSLGLLGVRTPQEQELIQELRGVVESIKCDEVKFE
jgi:hypothetical protein